MTTIKDSAIAEANRVLKIYRQNWGPGPVNPVQIAFGRGMKVIYENLSAEMPGYIDDPRISSPACMWLDSTAHPYRQRLCCARLLGLDAWYRSNDRQTYIARNGAKDLDSAAKEYSNYFALALMMPMGEFLQAVEENRYSNHLVDRFGVTERAVFERARMLGVEVVR